MVLGTAEIVDPLRQEEPTVERREFIWGEDLMRLTVSGARVSTIESRPG